ncbi:MAG TPA: transketolase [Blastocatellia bacterium]|nr:transketolase [Blastocatellia bacterium]
MKATEQTDVRIDELCINTIRTLSMDAVEQAKSGHPGTPMALAPVAYVLWDRFLRYNPRNPHWPNRDRFVLSNGHASMLLYSLLHLFGYDLSLEELKRFRQWDSKTPGHPEYGLTPGVETTTGPLGQGVSNSVGMAIAREWLAARFNRPEYTVVDYRVYAICGDGDLMEGIASEAASLAGHLALSNLTWIYDNNQITIEGKTSLAFSEDVAARFTAYRWNVLRVSDANDLASIDAAIRSAQAETKRPTLIILDSHIAWGAPHKQDTASAHGEPLGEDEIRLTKQRYGWPEDAKFLVPEQALEHAREAVARGAEAERQWQARLEEYLQAHPDLGREWRQIQGGELPEGWDSAMPSFPPDEKGLASRDAGSKVLNAIAPAVPWLIGGSADLAPSTKTLVKDGGDFEAGAYGSRNLRFGIREHAMGAVLNGMALSGLRPYGATFLIFSDYMKASIRLSALMEQPAIFIFTHDSVGVGEDGPTHQPIEQLMALRAIPNLFTFRPADANEVAESWRAIMGLKDHPAALVLTRQALPTLDRSKYASAEGVSRGAYTLADGGGVPQVILMATGSEVQLCVRAYEQLKASGVRARVVSMPCWELFERQPREYRDEVLPPQVRARVAVEAGTSLGWSEYVGLDGRTIARRQFGASAPFAELLKQFGFTVDNVVAEARALIEG